MKVQSAFAISAAALVFVFGSANAQSPAEFYKGTNLKVIAGTSAGSGYDTYARTLARHIGEHLPGKPSGVVTQNMPGAGSIVATNFISNVAPQDGSVIAAVQRDIALQALLGREGIKFKPMDLNWVGSLANEVGMIALWHTAKVKTLDDAFKTVALMGSSGANTTEIVPALLNNTLGTKFKVIHGYKSTSRIRLAMEKGEVEGIAQSWSSFSEAIPQHIEAGRVNVIAQLSLKKHPELTKMGVPLIFEVINKEHVLPKYTVEEVESFFRISLTPNAMGRPFTMGPKVPADRIKAVRAAFMAMAEDPDFISELKKQGRKVSVVSGDEIQEMIKSVVSAPQKNLDRLGELHKYQGDPTSK